MKAGDPDWLRVLRSLRAVGGRGICQRDWDQSGHTPDGGPRIPQIARRIRDLRGGTYGPKAMHGPHRAHVIENRGTRDGFTVYVLVREALPLLEPPPAPEPAPPALPLPSTQSSPLAGTPYDPFSEAA